MRLSDYLYREHILENRLFLDIQKTNFENENEWYYDFQDEIYEENLLRIKGA